jgi:NAD-dependent SIR2 family protein deacetylase
MQKQLEQAKKLLQDSECILVGASNGFSISEGISLFAENAAFDELFGDMKEKYGLRCLLHGMMAQWPTAEEEWGFWSRLVHHYVAAYHTSPLMESLKRILRGKEYFILTSNGETHFERAGIAPNRVYEIEGTWVQMQCSRGCHGLLYPAFDTLQKMAAEEKSGKVPAAMVPHCPECGSAMRIQMAAGAAFVSDEGARQRAADFIHQLHNKKFCVLELGIGPRNTLIKVPLMRLIAAEKQSFYITINLGQLFIPESIADRSVGIDGPLTEVLAALDSSL